MPHDVKTARPGTDSEAVESDSDRAFHHHLAILRLVHPPMTNREADYDRTEEELGPAFAKARLYGIAQRAELGILNLERDAERPWVLWICVGEVNETLRCCGQVDLTCFSGFTPDDFELEIGTVAPGRPNWSIKVWRNRKAGEFVVHLTPLRLLFWRSAEKRGIVGFDDYRRLLSVKLHYLGM